MFENCTTLLELSKARFEYVKSMHYDLVDINRAYNEKKKEIMKNAPKFKRLVAIRPVVDDIMYCGIAYAGENPRELTMTFTEKGFLT